MHTAIISDVVSVVTRASVNKPHPHSTPPTQWKIQYCVSKMAQRQRQRLRTLRNDPNLARFVVEGVPTGKQLGTGSYGTVEEVRRLGMASS